MTPIQRAGSSLPRPAGSYCCDAATTSCAFPGHRRFLLAPKRRGRIAFHVFCDSSNGRIERRAKRMECRSVETENAGGLWIEHANGDAIQGLRPRSLALLAISGDRRREGLTRDQVLAILWPDSPTDRPRHALARPSTISGETSMRM